jgi:hypothetical protein
MTDFLAAEDRALLERHGLALSTRSGPSSWKPWTNPTPMAVAGAACFAWSWKAGLLPQAPEQLPDPHPAWPFGEPSFAREFRNISRYNKLGIPALQAAFFGERKVKGEVQAILLTRALDGWDDLDSLLQRWSELSAAQHSAILQACGQLARQLHGVRQVHGCFYPKHIFCRLMATAIGRS